MDEKPKGWLGRRTIKIITLFQEGPKAARKRGDTFFGPTCAADNHQRATESLAAGMGKESISVKTELLLFGKKQELHWLVATGQEQNQGIM